MARITSVPGSRKLLLRGRRVQWHMLFPRVADRVDRHLAILRGIGDDLLSGLAVHGDDDLFAINRVAAGIHGIKSLSGIEVEAGDRSARQLKLVVGAAHAAIGRE